MSACMSTAWIVTVAQVDLARRVRKHRSEISTATQQLSTWKQTTLTRRQRISSLLNNAEQLLKRSDSPCRISIQAL